MGSSHESAFITCLGTTAYSLTEKMFPICALKNEGVLWSNSLDKPLSVLWRTFKCMGLTFFCKWDAQVWRTFLTFKEPPQSREHQIDLTWAKFSQSKCSLGQAPHEPPQTLNQTHSPIHIPISHTITHSFTSHNILKISLFPVNMYLWNIKND